MSLLQKARERLSRKRTGQRGKDATSPLVLLSAKSSASPDSASHLSIESPVRQDSVTSFLESTSATPASDSPLSASPLKASTTLIGRSPSAIRAKSQDNDESLGQDLWPLAFELALDREPDLMAAYQRHLVDTLRGSVNMSVDDLLSDGKAVETLVKELLGTREQKQWRFSVKGKDVEVREQAEKLAKFLLWADGMVKPALSAQPYAALAWSGVSILAPLLTSSSTQSRAMLEGFNLVSEVQQYWKIYEDTYIEFVNRHKFPEMMERLVNVYSGIIEYQARVICHLSRSQRSRAWQNVAAKTDWNAKAGHVDELGQKCKDYLTHDQQNRVAEVLDNQFAAIRHSCQVGNKILETLVQNRQEKLERRLLQDLASAASNYEGDKDFNPQRSDGSCEWFFADEQFRKWRDSDASSLLWVSAEPGWGKSVLSRSLIDQGYLDADTTTITASQSEITVSVESPTVCYFFFKDGNDRRTTSAPALCAILHQLFSHDSTGALKKLAFDSHKNKGSTLMANFAAMWGILMTCVQAPECGEVICVLDALDECDPAGQKQLFGELLRFYSRERRLSASKLKFLVTSRPYDTLEASFRKLSGSPAYLHFEGDDKVDDVRSDVDRFIEREVRQLPSNISPQDLHRISGQLKSMGNRTYLWIQLVFSIIEDDPSEYCRPEDIEHLLLNLPPRVSDAYQRILSRSKDSRITKALLEIVLAAAVPLNLDQAICALTMALATKRSASLWDLQRHSWTKEDFKNVVRSSCGLVIGIHDSELSFIHQTAREFLVTEPDPAAKWKGRFNSLANCHRTMSQSCMRLLILPDVRGWVPYNRILTHAFVNYASIYWTVHYAAQNAAAKEELRKDAWRLLENNRCRPQLWCQIYSFHLMGDEPFCNFAFGEQGWTALEWAGGLGLLNFVTDALAREDIDIDGKVQHEKEYVALRAATVGDQRHVIRWFLDKLAKVAAEDDAYRLPLCEAAERGDSELMQMFLPFVNRTKITDGVLGCAAKNQANAKEVMTLLFKVSGDEVPITPHLLEIAAANTGSGGGKELVVLLFQKSRNENQATEKVIIAMAQNRRHVFELISWLLARDAEREVIITGDVIKAAAANTTFGYDLVEILLHKRGDNARVTDDLLMTAMRNPTHGLNIIKLILETHQSEMVVSEDVLVEAAGLMKHSVLDLLLTFLGDELQITEKLVKAMARNRYRMGMLCHILESHGNKLNVTEGVVAAAAGSGSASMAVLLRERGAEVKVTAKVVRAARHDKFRGKDAYSWKDLYSCEDTAPAAFAHDGQKTMALLLRERGDEVKALLPELSPGERRWVETCSVPYLAVAEDWDSSEDEDGSETPGTMTDGY